MNLNLGGGGHNPDGFVEVDRQSGQEIYPLPFGDGVADVIRASHCLEHFSHKVVGDVVKEWVRVLKPGGVLRIAVPDFRKIALWYAQGRNDLPLQLYLMGGQTDENDYHKTIFEHGLLKQVMEDAGLENIRHWTSGR
jgi:predicted SAM-dependent methyltransferase